MTNDVSNNIHELLNDPLAPARDAARAIGYVGLDIPEDILAAPPLFAAHLPWSRSQETPWADRWLESSFPGWARCMLEDWAAGRFDFMTHVVFTRGDDTSQRLYYYVCELQRRGAISGPEPVIFDVARIPTPTSEAWTISAVRRLAEDLEVDGSNLAEGIRRANSRRELMAAVNSDRGLPSPWYEQFARASLFAPVEDLPRNATPSSSGSSGKVLLAGSSPPDDSLHLAIDSAGWSVAGELYDRNLERLGEPIEAQGGDPYDRVGTHAVAGRTGTRSFVDRSARLVELVEQRKVSAVIHWLYEEDEAIAWDVVKEARELRACGVPSLVMARRRWDLGDEPEKAIVDFLGSLES